MNILIIDAQGGGVGKQLVSAIKQHMLSMKLRLSEPTVQLQLPYLRLARTMLPPAKMLS